MTQNCKRHTKTFIVFSAQCYLNRQDILFQDKRALPLGFSGTGGPLSTKYHPTSWPPARTLTTLTIFCFLYITVSHFQFSHPFAWRPCVIGAAVPCYSPDDARPLADHHHHDNGSVYISPPLRNLSSPDEGSSSSESSR